jgi:hypothetical protein
MLGVARAATAAPRALQHSRSRGRLPRQTPRLLQLQPAADVFVLGWNVNGLGYKLFASKELQQTVVQHDVVSLHRNKQEQK